jgi:Trp operon repressor
VNIPTDAERQERAARWREQKALLREVIALLIDNAPEDRHIAARAIFLAKALDLPPYDPEGYTQRDIARKLGVSPARVCQAINSIEARLNELLSNTTDPAGGC